MPKIVQLDLPKQTSKKNSMSSLQTMAGYAASAFLEMEFISVRTDTWLWGEVSDSRNWIHICSLQCGIFHFTKAKSNLKTAQDLTAFFHHIPTQWASCKSSFLEKLKKKMYFHKVKNNLLQEKKSTFNTESILYPYGFPFLWVWGFHPPVVFEKSKAYI